MERRFRPPPRRREVEEPQRSSAFLFLIGGALAVLLLAVGGVAGWFIAGNSFRSDPDNLGPGAAAPPPQVVEPTVSVERTPKPTFTPPPSLPTLEVDAPIPTPTPAQPPGAIPRYETRIPPADDIVLFRVTLPEIVLRAGPGAGFDVVATAVEESTLLVVGRTSDGTWWRVCCIEDDSAWLELSGENVVAEGDVASVPVVGP